MAVAGAVVMALGLLFVGQALGYIRWPASSFMINNSSWIYYGAVIAIAGVGLIALARRRSP